MRRDEIFDHKQKIFCLDLSYVLEVLDELQPAHLQKLFDSGSFFATDLFDDVGTIPVGVFEFDEFFPQLNRGWYTLSDSLTNSSLSFSSRFSMF